ncbi:stalk domain-containing protein [Cohnella sp. GCM10012308]|uniref:stalk domain-containing protein n=1 Tax=Cohnella sp. GCM10012308 TaxID=3317329 RepID=UPI00360767F5
MKKTILTLSLGMLLGAVATAASPAYGAAKQYVLTLFEKPVIVNGTKYADAANPILNYNGKTYIPLAKIGDLTGVQYKWNAAKNQVEIGGSSSSSSGGTGSSTDNGTPATPCESTGQKGCTLNPDTPIEKPPVVGYKGHADSEDPSYQMALAMGRADNDYPPVMSKGWISEAMLEEMIGTFYTTGTVPGETIFAKGSLLNPQVIARFYYTEEYRIADEGDFIFSGIHIKKYYGNIFYNISDLEKLGAL